MQLGIENLCTNLQKLVRNRRVGLVANPASCDAELIHTLDRLRGAGAEICALFGPEHGFGGEAQDMEPVDAAAAGPGTLAQYSLYGKDEESLTPPDEALSGLDALVVDLPDIGSRYYTFVWTTVLCLRACHRNGVDLIVTDRPNPLGGELVEGAPQQPDTLSFVGLLPVANRHGLTAGELIGLAASTEGTEAALTVVPMKGWRRSQLFGQTGLHWIPPSPNMPTFDTALVYPGMCLIEGTWASEGRGTTRPFEQVGAPGLNGADLAARLDEMDLPGVRFRPVSFKPGFQKHAGRICGGVFVHVTDRARFLPYRTGVALLLALKAEAKERFEWRADPYEFVSDRPAIDLLCGSSEVRQAVNAGVSLEEVQATWQAGERNFTFFKKQFELYRY